jgi:hypothetical protein
MKPLAEILHSENERQTLCFWNSCSNRANLVRSVCEETVFVLDGLGSMLCFEAWDSLIACVGCGPQHLPVQWALSDDGESICLLTVIYLFFIPPCLRILLNHSYSRANTRASSVTTGCENIDLIANY